MIYLCRHGQTTFNAAHRYQGQVDSPLTALGQAQAVAMGHRLAGLVGPVFKVWASPLGRAQQTLALIMEQLGPAPVVTDPRLMEVSMGAWDGLDDVEIEAEYPGARDGLSRGQWYFHGPGGETFAGFAARLAAAMAEIMADPAPVQVVVAHGVVSRVIRGRFAGLSEAAMLAGQTPQDGFYALGPDGVRFIAC
ncbi:MAG: histidine phosphatase family protein [bacterium]